MSHLLKQRKAILATLVTIAITTHGLVLDNMDWILSSTDAWTKSLQFLLSGGFVYSSMVLIPIFLYDKFFWRWINPRYNFFGVWNVTITKLRALNGAHVTEAGLDEAEHLAKQITCTSVEATIRQTPFRTWVEEATGDYITDRDSQQITWTGEVVGNHLPGKITVVFEAAVDGSISGRDHLVVKKRDWLRRPILLVGNAFHVFSHFDIVIKGDIEYKRKTRKTRTPKSLPENRVVAPNDEGASQIKEG